MSIIKLVIEQGLDEKGELEQFTCDLYPLEESGDFMHLDNDGLPTKGTRITEGMVIVGKSGMGKAFDPNNMPTSLELNGLSREELAEKYKDYWTNASLYARREMVGIVREARFETINGKLCAIVEIEQ